MVNRVHILLFGLLVTVPVLADSSLHVDIPSPLLAGGDNTTVGPNPGPNQNPDAIRTDGQYLIQPDVMTGAKGQLTHGQSPQTQRSKSYTPDTTTGADATLHYEAVFNPSIVPFKRMSALSVVKSDFSIQSNSGSFSSQPLPVGGSVQSHRDLFWASLYIELKPGTRIAIPSVSPDMRILSYETKQRIKLDFTKDAADNFFVQPKASTPAGKYRLVLLVDGSANYFAPSIPFGYTINELVQAAPAQILPSLPANVQAEAQKALSKLKLTGNTELRDALDILTNYFRGFEAKPLNTSGNTFWDIFSQQAGVCRHRSYAFTIVAQALGMPTRFVSNEAHVWVEVWLPGNTWARVDLGGAAATLDVSNASGKAIYRSRSADPFAKPKNYQQNYTQLQGDVKGLTDEQKKTKQESRRDDKDNKRDDKKEKKGIPTVDAEELKGKSKTELTVDFVDNKAFRGEEITVTGNIRTEAKSTKGLRIDIYLAEPGRPDTGIKIGHGFAEANGTYSLQLALPKGLKTRNYTVYAHTPGNARLAPSVSQ